MKKLTSIMLTAALVVSLGMTTAFAEKTEAKITVNGTPVVIADGDQKPYNDSEISRVFVPIRAALYAFGYEDGDIAWNQDSQTVTTTDKNTGVVTKIDLKTQKYSITQGTGVWEGTLDVAGRVENGRTLVPIRTFSETYFKNVGWEQDTQTVRIDDVYNDTTVAVMDTKKTNELTAGQRVKATVATDGTYEWKVEDNKDLIYFGKNAEGVGNYSYFFSAPKAVEGEVTLTLTPVKVDDKATLPEAKNFKITVKAAAPEGGQTEGTTGGAVGMPNPRTEYKTEAELEAAVGFKVFSFADVKDSNYENPKYAGIKGTESSIGEVVYNVKGYDDRSEFTVRTADGDRGDISGVYGLTYKEKDFDGLPVHYGMGTGDLSSAAYFTKDGFTYSISCNTGYTEEVFLNAIEDVLKAL